jgi:hypothetical protein
MFLAAALFFDVCRQFGELTPEVSAAKKPTTRFSQFV